MLSIFGNFVAAMAVLFVVVGTYLVVVVVFNVGSQLPSRVLSRRRVRYHLTAIIIIAE